MFIKNVTDAASSKAFLQLAAQFPPGKRFAANLWVSAACLAGVNSEPAVRATPQPAEQVDVAVAETVNGLVDAVAAAQTASDNAAPALPVAGSATPGPAHSPVVGQQAHGTAAAVAGVLSDLLDAVAAAEGGSPADELNHSDMVDWEAVRVAPMEEVLASLVSVASSMHVPALCHILSCFVCCPRTRVSAVEQVAEAIQCRGMHLMLAERIQVRATY